MKAVHNPYMRIKGWLRGKGLTYKDVADVLGISAATVSAKINGQSDFLLSEIEEIRKQYNLDRDIFFTDGVA